MPLVWKVSQVLTGILNNNSITTDISAKSFKKAKHLSLKIWSSAVFTFPSESPQPAQLEQEVRGWSIEAMVWGKIREHLQCAGRGKKECFGGGVSGTAGERRRPALWVVLSVIPVTKHSLGYQKHFRALEINGWCHVNRALYWEDGVTGRPVHSSRRPRRAPVPCSPGDPRTKKVPGWATVWKP